MKKLLLLILIGCKITLYSSFAQTTANYSRTSSNTASLVSMAGSTQLISASRDDFASELTSIGFNFWFMGVRYNSFSASSNGAMALGNTVIATTNHGNNFPFASQAIIAPFLQNMETSSAGKVHFINNGLAPNRTLTIEFLNMGLNNSSTGANGTFQITLYETTGIIQFTYGSMAIGAITGTNARIAVIGFCSNNTAGTVMSVTHASPFTTNTTATPTTVSYGTAGNIAGLNSAANGSRVQLTFTPPVLNAPLSLSFSATSINSTTLTWTQLTVAGEMGFVILKSDDAGATYDFAFQTGVDATTATISPMLANKNYIFKVYSLSEGGFSAQLTGNVTTGSCGSFLTNTATFNTQGNTNWTALAWSLGHVPTSCENAVIIFNRSTGLNDSSSVVLDVDASVNSLSISNASTTTIYKKQVYFTGNKRMEINTDLTILCPSANKYSRMQWNVTDNTIINGNLIVGNVSPGATEGYSTVGSTGNTPNQNYIMRGNAIFYKRSLIIDEHAIFIFDGVGSQQLINNTGTMATDTFNDALLFEKLIIGNGNAPTLTFTGSNYQSNMNDKARAGVIIGPNASLVLPFNFSLNAEGAGLYFKMGSGSKLKCGGNTSTDGYGVAGSNFTAGYTNYMFDPSSTVEYNGLNNITQTIHNGVSYSNLTAFNGSGSGRAQKITTGPLTVNTSFNINALADVTLGILGSSNCAVSCGGPLNVLGTGGLYCNANVISGVGAFSLGNFSYLGMGHAQGISILGSATGNVQLTGGRTYNTTGNYIYNGLVAQITGNGLSTTCNDLTIDNPTIVTIATNQLVNGVNLLKQGTFDIGSTKITINGIGILNSTGGLMKANVGMVEMKGTSGTAQGLAGSWFVGRNISTLINANTTGITIAPTLNDTLLISSALLYESVTNSAITTNDNLTLLSRDTSTARFGEIVTGSGNSINGKANIERYMYAKKSWRLLATPISVATAPTVTIAWRESAVNTLATGYGTQITGPAGFVGMDSYTQRASMKYYNSATNNFIDVINTNTTTLANNRGYFLFVRGDRAVPITGAAGITILRMKGNVLTGDQAFPVSALKFESIGNPYPSRIDFRTVTKTTIANSFIAWNPTSAGMYNVGAYETYAFNGTNYVKAGGVVRNFIESGEAFYIQSNTASAGSLLVKESDKTASSSLQSRINVNPPSLHVTLFATNTDSAVYVADGVMVDFDTSYSSGFDNDDVRKFLNTYDNLAIPLSGYNLFAERRTKLQQTDTIRLSISALRIGNYQFKIDATTLQTNGIDGFLKDSYLGTETLIKLDGTTQIKFEVDNDPESKISTRFTLLFRPVEVLSNKFLSIAAVRNNNKNVITWITDSEINTAYYTVEFSENGQNFIDLDTIHPAGNNGASHYYNYLHECIGVEKMYYRIKAFDIKEKINYSKVVKLTVASVSTGLSIMPNPVVGKRIKVYLNDAKPGIFPISISSVEGNVLFETQINLPNKGASAVIHLTSILSTGTYFLRSLNEDGNSIALKFVIL